MSHLINGGRIVPILTGSDSNDPTLEVSAFLDASLPPIPMSPISSTATMPRPLQKQIFKPKPVQSQSLDMPSLEERGLFAFPTKGDGKLITPAA